MLQRSNVPISLLQMGFYWFQCKSKFLISDAKIQTAVTSEISVAETITETEIIDPMLTETETIVFLKTEII